LSVRKPGANTPASASWSIQRFQSSPPITATVAAASSSLAGAMVVSKTSPVSVLRVLMSTGLPSGLIAER
jgi:hypothetical protein